MTKDRVKELQECLERNKSCYYGASDGIRHCVYFDEKGQFVGDRCDYSDKKNSFYRFYNGDSNYRWRTDESGALEWFQVSKKGVFNDYDFKTRQSNLGVLVLRSCYLDLRRNNTTDIEHGLYLYLEQHDYYGRLYLYDCETANGWYLYVSETL